MKLAEASVTVLENKNQLLPFKTLDSLKIAEVCIGTAEKNTFGNILNKYASVDHFGVEHDTPQKLRDTILARLKNYNYVIVFMKTT